MQNEFEQDEFHSEFHNKKKPSDHGHSHGGNAHGHSHGNNIQVSSKQILNGREISIQLLSFYSPPPAND